MMRTFLSSLFAPLFSAAPAALGGMVIDIPSDLEFDPIELGQLVGRNQIGRSVLEEDERFEFYRGDPDPRGDAPCKWRAMPPEMFRISGSSKRVIYVMPEGFDGKELLPGVSVDLAPDGFVTRFVSSGNPLSLPNPTMKRMQLVKSRWFGLALKEASV